MEFWDAADRGVGPRGWCSPGPVGRSSCGTNDYRHRYRKSLRKRQLIRLDCSLQRLRQGSDRTVDLITISALIKLSCLKLPARFTLRVDLCKVLKRGEGSTTERPGTLPTIRYALLGQALTKRVRKIECEQFDVELAVSIHIDGLAPLRPSTSQNEAVFNSPTRNQ